MPSDYCLPLVYCHPVANLPHFRRRRALLSSPKMSLYQQRGTAHVLRAGEEASGTTWSADGKATVLALPWAASVCLLYSSWRRGEGLSSQAGSHTSLRTWPAVVERGLEQCPLRWGVLKSVKGSLQGWVVIKTLLSPEEKEGRRVEESFIHCLLVTVMEGRGQAVELYLAP